ncbi:MAG: hypothetical protein R3185_00045 [Candidatus Thermoplasmatota archaeon]|nr:hypothetical protein [Candidatus Thermoplasmatota archaeon]
MFAISVWLALASGVAFLALGATMLMIRNWGGQNLLFAGFAMVWGLQILTANLARGLDAGFLVVAYLPLLPVIALFLVGFSTGFPASRRRPAWGTGLVLVLAAVSLAAAGLFALDVTQLLEGIVGSERGGIQQATGLAPFLLTLPFYAGFYVACTHLCRVWKRSRGVIRSQAGILLAGLLLFTSYAPVAWVGALLPAPQARAALGMTWTVLVTIAVIGLPILAWIAWTVHVHGEGRERRLLLASLGVPLVAAVIEGGAALSQGGGEAPTLGIWRLLAVAVVAFGIARYQLFDLDLKAHFAIRHGGTSAVVVALFFVISEAIETQLPLGGFVPSVAGAAAIALALVPIQRATERVADGLLPGAKGRARADLARRREEVYQGAVERALKDGRIVDQERDLLDHLRISLELPLDTCARLEAQARGLVIPG